MKNLIIVLLLGCSTILHAQNSITGTVTDLKNQPIPGVEISATDIHSETTTDSNGKYTLTNIPSGNYIIVFAYPGFKTINKSIKIEQKETILDVLLDDEIVHMDEVIVSTAFHKLQSQNVMKVEQESIKSMQQKGAATLIEGLSTIPGVSQIATGTSIGKPVIRGLSGNRVLVYTQGVRLENQQFGEEHGLGLNDAGVESVEVIKGPASLLHGSDAMGGVLYFNPEKFAKANTSQGNFSQKVFSNTLGSNSTVGLKTSTENWKYLIRGSYNTHSDYQIANNDRVTNTRYNESDLKTGIEYDNSKFSSVFRYNFNHLDLGIPENGIAAQSTTKKTDYPKQGVFNHILSLHNHIYFKNSSLDADFGYIANDRSEFEDSDIAVLHMKLKTLNYDLRYHFPKWGNIETIAGIQGMHQTNLNSGEEFLIPDAETDDFGIFGTANYEWKSNVIQMGLRFDNRQVVSEQNGIFGEEGYFEDMDKTFNSFNASLGYKTNMTKNWSVRLNVASGFRAPNLAELTSNGVHEGSNRYEIGNSNLESEQNVQTDLNLEYKTDHLEFFVNGFYNHINNYIFISPTGNTIDGNDLYQYVQDNAKLSGGEIGLHFHPHPIDWLHFESNFETVSGEKQNGDYLPLIPARKWNNSIRTQFNLKKWLTDGFATFNIENTFSQKNVSGFETKTHGYTLANFAFGGKITVGKTIFDLNLNVNNLLDKEYISHLSRLKTDGIPNIGRNIIVGVNFNI
ncbi:TonB-dependent receptor [Flavobacterium sp. GT3R68]|uniref:TonB-dependent receptor n=1 Tax=Flavobacterium sp. GT3R68 TaxID=2594437 RepID=UPI000F869999|nr:TonB-dependent receptor [Flavobacterium sp. GT3R68]RTY93893.1 TonB-dependent receptor [Flavobacterium sp. GSN2]TRW93493.1 TonB-dependent receptor [Flavobacterium sp. GT3R68]